MTEVLYVKRCVNLVCCIEECFSAPEKSNKLVHTVSSCVGQSNLFLLLLWPKPRCNMPNVSAGYFVHTHGSSSHPSLCVCSLTKFFCDKNALCFSSMWFRRLYGSCACFNLAHAHTNFPPQTQEIHMHSSSTCTHYSRRVFLPLSVFEVLIQYDTGLSFPCSAVNMTRRENEEKRRDREVTSEHKMWKKENSKRQERWWKSQDKEQCVRKDSERVREKTPHNLPHFISTSSWSAANLHICTCTHTLYTHMSLM